MSKRFTLYSPSDLRVGLGSALSAGLTLILIRRLVGPLGGDATVMPIIAAGGMLVFGMLLAVSAFAPSPIRQKRGSEGGEELQEPLPKLGAVQMARFVAVIVAVLLHAWLLPWFGVLLGGFSLQVLIYLLIGIHPLRGVVFSLGVVVFLYLIIGLLLGVRLPLGVLG